MASIVGSRPNHYDALGLSPSATEDEIAKAFGKAMGLFGTHSAAAAAQLGAAFETLRNPAKRRAYDASMGFGPKPQPVRQPTSVSFRITARVAGPEPHVEPRADEPAAAPPRQPQAATEPERGSFIAAALRDIAKPVVIDIGTGSVAKKEAARVPEELPAATIERLLGPRQEGLAEAEDRPIDWRRPAVAVGAVVLAAGLVGTLAGISVKDEEQGQAAVTAPLPAARPQAHAARPAAAAPGAPPVLAETPVSQPHQALRPRNYHQDRIGLQQPGAPTASKPTDTDQVADAAAAPSASEQAAADPLAPEPQSMETVAAAGLPLATKLVARTIDKIGYACGEVASATPADGEAAGVYKVTCTSGQTYRAAPVHGRYRFRRWGAH